MILGIVVFVLIVGSALYLKFGPKLSTSNLAWSKVGSFLGGVVILVVVCWVGYRGYKWSTKPPAPQNPATTQVAQAPTVIVQRGPIPIFHPFGADGCYETTLGYEARWSPKDKAMRVHDPAGGSHVEALDKRSPISAFGPGKWRFCKEDPDATGVMIWE